MKPSGPKKGIHPQLPGDTPEPKVGTIADQHAAHAQPNDELGQARGFSPSDLEVFQPARTSPSPLGGQEVIAQETMEMSRLSPAIGPIIEPIMGTRWIWQHPEWPRFKWDMGELAEPLAKATGAQGQLRMVGRVLDKNLTREALAEIIQLEGISTSAIEGEYLNPASVAASVARHLNLSWDRTSPLSRDADGLVGVLCDATERHAEPLSIERLCEWQKALFPESRNGMGRIATGTLRPDEVVVQSGPIGRELVDFEGIPRKRLENDLEAFISWFNESRGSINGLVRAGTAHLWLVTLHPFEDGNGRLTRAVTDLALAQDEGRSDFLYRMSSRINAVKGEYYSALKQAQAFDDGMNVTPWLKWFLAQVPEACETSGKTVKRVLAKVAFWAQHRELDLNQRQRKVLNRLLDAGPSGFEGGINARKYENLAKTTKTTATRDLTDLVQAGCLVHVGGGGRSTSYDIPWDQLIQ